MVAFDLDAILEREARRARALVAGSKHTGPDGPRWQGPRADAVSELDAPELLWPTERARVPARCLNCGAGRAAFVVTAPYGFTRRGSIDCLMCNRTLARLRDDKTRRVD